MDVSEEAKSNTESAKALSRFQFERLLNQGSSHSISSSATQLMTNINFYKI